jgi:hypothetical protein
MYDRFVRMHTERIPTEISAIKEKRELVERVANSTVFQRSPRLREFLLYVADCTISDRLEGVREQQIAENVFNRKPDYNSGQDNIVRVEARSLRKRLDAYFAAEGKDEPIILSMPKGSYSVCFEPRPHEFEALAAPVEISDLAEVPVMLPSGQSPWLVGVLLAIIAALAVLVAVQWQSARSVKAVLRPAPALFLPFSALLEDTKDTYIVTSDSSLVLIQDLKRRQISLDDYITGRYMGDTTAPGSDPVRQDLIRTLLKRRYTNAAETTIAGRIIQMNSRASKRVLLRSGHGVQLSDFKDHNIVLLGSPVSNPWDRLFSESLNFQFEWDQARRGMFRNRAPRPGEQPVYSMTSFAGDSGEAYAVVAFVPNVNGEGHALLIAGTTAEGTEAAGEFIIDEARVSAALKAIGIDPAGRPRHFEILLEAKTIAGSASKSTILASRLISDTR